jgi:hypothetical protein
LSDVPALDISGMLGDLSVEIGRVKNLYDQYFLGMEKLPPTIPRKDVEKTLGLLAQQAIGNTALRFRFQMLQQRWKTYSERWDKILREIENGTYPIHRERARRRSVDDAPPLSRHAEPPSPSSVVPGMNDADLRALHRTYLDALRSLGDRRDVRYEALLGSLAKQVPSLLERNRCRELTFSVVIRDGKVVVKAQPK